jgi:large subunit ribosomal protein L9
MRVIFLQDVPNVARAGEVKEVADGYGRNFLIPRKLAALAHPQAVSQVETQAQKMEAHLTAELKELASQLEGKEVSLKAKAGAKERLYGSITSADIATELNKTTGLDVDKRKIELEEPIRQLGSYEIAIRLGKDIVPKIRVTVTEEEAPKAEEKPPKKAAKKKTTKAEKKAPKKEKKVAKKEEKAPKAEEKAKVEKKAPKKEKKTTKAEKKAPKKKTTKKEEKA